MSHKVCIHCNKKKSISKFDDGRKICNHCRRNGAKDREVEIGDLLIILEKIHDTLSKLTIEQTTIQKVQKSF